MAGRPHLPGFSPELLKHHRELKGWNHRELASRAGVDRSAVYKLEQPGARAIAASVQKLATALGVPVDALLEATPVTGLESLRTRKAMSQADVAKELGMERTTYAAIESGQVISLPAEMAQGLAELFSVSPEAIEDAHQLDVERAWPSLRITLRLNDQEADALAARLAGRPANPDALGAITKRLDQARTTRRERSPTAPTE